jgi:isoleucyl-tRNA synthetase
MYSVNQPGESKNFDEKTVAELHNKVFNLLYNVLAFYELYRDKNVETGGKNESQNILDKWILARLNQLVHLVTEQVDNFKLLEPVRAIRDFIDDLSTWYVRRSRERLKEGDTDAKQTLYVVLKTLAQVMAPFAPFAAEDIWQKLKNENDAMSVHMTMWPESKQQETREGILEKMKTLREVVSEGLKARQVLNIPVRQPLASVSTSVLLDANLVAILKEELNVKEVVFAKSETFEVKLDATITSELKREGEYRELVRMVQDMRKKEGLQPQDGIALTLPAVYKETLVGFEDELKKTVSADTVAYVGELVTITRL